MPVLKAFKKRLDPRRYNGASFLGLRGIVVKSHGGADSFSFLQAIHTAIASGAAMNAQIDEAEKKNPVSNFSQIARLLRILIAKFSVEGVSDPAKLELANALCRTALDYFKEEGREKERLADQQRFYEANKSAREKALELCLEEAKPYPEVTEQFKAAFAALKKARAGK